jgi:hypothetical protein
LRAGSTTGVLLQIDPPKYPSGCVGVCHSTLPLPTSIAATLPRNVGPRVPLTNEVTSSNEVTPT